MKAIEEVKEYLETEISACFDRARKWNKEALNAKEINLEYITATQMANWYEGQEIALRKLLRELTK